MTDRTNDSESKMPAREPDEFAGTVPTPNAQQSAGESNQPGVPGPTAEADGAMNLDLVMDVELNVTLRFGQRQLTLREVLELTTGSVVELDRQIEEPVELLLDGKVIARGEAVVIDGNYGVRVLEVTHPLKALQLRA